MKGRFALWSLCLWGLTMAGTWSGCAYFSKNASIRVAVEPNGVAERAGRVAIPVFIQEKYKAGKGAKRWPDSPVTDRFATGLLQQGYSVVDRSVVQKALNDNGIYSNGILREDDISKIGKLLKADVVVLGKLTLVEQADGRTLSRKVTARGVRVSDGRTVFSLSAVDTTLYRVLSGEDLVDQALAGMTDIAQNVAQEGGGGASASTSSQMSEEEDIYSDLKEPAQGETASAADSSERVEVSPEGPESSPEAAAAPASN
jgi:hypothetical protein